MMKNIALLGSTGSIGRNVLTIVRQFPGRYRIRGLAAGSNIELLREQIESFNPDLVSVADSKLAAELTRRLPAEWGPRIMSGREGNERVATLPEVDTVVSSIVGAAGLAPTMAAIRAGKHVALANKETLVMAGELIINAAREHGVKLIPIDSEHSAILQSMASGECEEISRIILTASGGPFRQLSERELWDVTPEKALAHPNWDMGKKITIDSATLMNKGLEVIEAHWLFGIDLEQIEVLVHPQSIVHSLVEFIDGSVVAQMGIPDMKIPIAYALAYPERLRTGLPRLNLAKIRELSFFPPDFNKFPALRLAYQVLKHGGTLPAVMNAANEVAVAAFLDGRIRFPEIIWTVAETVKRSERREVTDIPSVLEADLAARMLAESVVEALELKTRRSRGEETATPELPPLCDSFSSKRAAS